jgi:hypothetical protein
VNTCCNTSFQLHVDALPAEESAVNDFDKSKEELITELNESRQKLSFAEEQSL